MKPFDISSCPLNGTILIEASAGTGKTYTITELYLRLIAEKFLTTDQILVVTFTEAATQELKDRIRSKLREAVIRKKYSHQDIERLNAAIRDFDESAIFTIHGFCRRMLHEYAFESGSLFDTELLSNQEHIRQEIVEDFWRRNFYKASRIFVNYALSKISPDKLLKLLKNTLHYPDIRILPEIREEENSDKEEIAYKAAFDAVSSAWISVKPHISDILTKNKVLNGNRYKAASIPKWIDNVDEMIALGSDYPFLADGFDKFTSETLASSVNKNCEAPKHEFFDLCSLLKHRHQELEAAFETRLMRLKIQLFQQARQEMRCKKQSRNIRSFDDLLLDMYEALQGEHGDRLAEQIRGKFKAALIDEFQDTDPVQYSIFNKIFNAEDHALFLIGDPKQAIYAFRGADVFAYMEAAKNADNGFTLEQNWRSDLKLVQAVNTIFEHHPNPFIYEEIRFQPVHAANQKVSEDPLMTIWLMPASSEKAVSKTSANRQIPMSVASEISELLHHRKVLPADIAVLVLRNTEAMAIQKALSMLNIPSVLYSNANLFDSEEAAEMERVLAAIAEPLSEKHIRSALATGMIGVSGEEAEQMMRNESLWEKRLIRFGEYHELWRRRGFIRMFNEFMRRENILSRLVRLVNGERRITDILHLSEVLHQAAIEKKLSMTGLVKWLSQQRDPDIQRLEEYQLRLETDEHAVKVVTVHKSKGLEYPVVFCPFLWNDFDLRKDMLLFHDENRRITIDLDSGSDRYRESAQKERRAENLRLLYVALTRAKHRCYFICGWFNQCESSGMTYLLHRDKTLNHEQIYNDLKEIEEKSSESIRVCKMPDERGKIYQPFSEHLSELEYRKFNTAIDRSFRISSFSSLTTQHPHSAEIPDYDESGISAHEVSASIITESPANPYSIHQFPRGAKTGIFLHELFEHLDFTSDTPTIQTLASEKLHAYGFEEHWLEAIVGTVRNTLSVPLESERKNFTLSRISNDQRLNELEFYFPLQEISPRTVTQIFARYSHHDILADFPEQTERLNFPQVKGFMKGFMDMVFEYENQYYLVDWKSNFLGERIEDYHQEKLRQAMNDDFYILQYHLYVLALHQYLRLRMPEYRYDRHFGGVFYIFLRGIHPETPQFGIFRDKPDESLIHELYENLIAGNC